MARRRRVTFARAPRTQIVRVGSSRPAAPIVIRQASGLAGYRRRAAAAFRRGATRAATLAREETHTLTALGAAAALGFVESRGIELPVVDVLGKAGTYAVGAWLLGRYTGNRTARHVATGLGAIAVYEMVKGWSA